MKIYIEKKFNIGELKGISKKNIEDHLKLYSAYVTNANKLLAENQPKLGFEFGGMKNHEIYFASLEGGANPINDGNILKAIKEDFGSFDAWLTNFKTLALTRGIGWAMLYYDKNANEQDQNGNIKKCGRLINAWIDEQHIGHLPGLPVVLALDMFEHAFISDYGATGKKQYIEDFFANLNWNFIEQNFSSLLSPQ